jgi:hypothetical protein
MVEWNPPATYTPRDSLIAYLKSVSPPVNTALFDMVVYVQWRTRPVWQKMVDEAWNELQMIPDHARDAIANSIVPMEVYDKAVARALEQS